MTTPVERTRAVLNTERFLIDLRDSNKYPDVPKTVREEAQRLLKHYPSKYNMKHTMENG